MKYNKYDSDDGNSNLKKESNNLYKYWKVCDSHTKHLKEEHSHNKRKMEEPDRREDVNSYERKRERDRKRKEEERYSNNDKYETKSSSTATREKKRKKYNEEDKYSGFDDSDHHYIIKLGEDLIPRYKILSIMGEGTFGKVVECWDREEKKYVAVKIIRAIEKYREAAMIEIDVLKAIKKKDPEGEKPCIQLKSWFDFRNHVCMVFDKFGLSLFDFLKKNMYKPFKLDHIQQFAFQLLEAVSFLHDELSLIHTDLKPENILLVYSGHTYGLFNRDMVKLPTSTLIKLIDFGSATFEDQHHTSIVSTRHYRAPEVMLGLGWSYPCDIFSIGCILVELFTGDAMFQTHENHEHFKLMEITLGSIPIHMIDSSSSGKKYFQTDRVIWPGKAKSASVEHVKKQPTLWELIKPNCEQEDLFFDLIEKLLAYDPSKRITAKQARKHPFFKYEIEL